MFTYNIAKEANKAAFDNACALIETYLGNFKKENLLEDVDGTQIQIYDTPNGKIKVYNDYEVDAVYVDSDVNLENAM